MIRIAAVDDEMHVLERFERMVTDVKEIKLCGLFETGEKLLLYLKDNTVDAVFLDIEMPGVNGLQLSQEILNLDGNIEIIFATAFNQYAIEAFELQAMDYIMKPLTEERLRKTIRRLLKIKNTLGEPVKPFIQCFGGFEVFIKGEVLTWKNSKAKEVLAFLVQKKGVPVNWEKIADAVWPDYDSEKSQTNFHATTYLLRKTLTQVGMANILESGRGNYRVVKDKLSCDVYQLEDLIMGNEIKVKEDFALVERFKQRGYMEGSGYAWAYPKAGELDERCKNFLNNYKK